MCCAILPGSPHACLHASCVCRAGKKKQARATLEIQQNLFHHSIPNSVSTCCIVVIGEINLQIIVLIVFCNLVSTLYLGRSRTLYEFFFFTICFQCKFCSNCFCNSCNLLFHRLCFRSAEPHYCVHFFWKMFPSLPTSGEDPADVGEWSERQLKIW